jgi:predicted negative regulator of RcsB-dependent stress response
MSPDYAWWYGYADVLGHLARLRDEEHQLRQAQATARRTTFMLLTGPIMVLVVLLAAWLGWRAWQRRGAR